MAWPEARAKWTIKCYRAKAHEGRLSDLSAACPLPVYNLLLRFLCFPGVNTTLDIHRASLHNPINGKQWICCLQCEKQSHHENPRPGNTDCDRPKDHPSHSCTASGCQVLPLTDTVTPSHACPTHTHSPCRHLSCAQSWETYKSHSSRIGFNHWCMKYKQKCVTFLTLGVDFG